MTDTRNGFVIDSRAGNRNGDWIFSNSAAYELSIEDVRGGFEMGLLVDLDYALDNSGLPRQDPRTIPDAAYINLGHNRIGSVTLGRIPLFNRNFRGIDGAKVALNIFPKLRLEGLFGMRRALTLASDNGIEHSYDGIAFGAALAGEIAGFGGRLSFMGGAKDGSATRRDLDALLSWQIIRQIFAHAKISTNLIVKELAEVSGGLRLNFDPVVISGHAGWTDPSLMLFDADDPWIVFASERQRQEGADVSVRLASQRLLLGASFLHGSNIEYGLGAFAKFLGMQHYLDLFKQCFLILPLQKYGGSAMQTKQSSPKIIVLNHALTHAYVPFKRSSVDPGWKGFLFESVLGAHLAQIPNTQLYYWRDGKYEMDFVLKTADEIFGIEVKSGFKRKASGILPFTKHFPKARTEVWDFVRTVEFMERGKL